MRGNVLLMTVVAAKSDDYDLATETVRENPLSLRLFGLVVPPFRKLLRRPVWARNILDVPPGWHAYRDIGYTDAAAAWEQAGGELCQVGVANIRYSTRHPDPARSKPSGLSSHAAARKTAEAETAVCTAAARKPPVRRLGRYDKRQTTRSVPGQPGRRG